MGFEYVSPATLTQDDADALFNALKQDMRYELLPNSNPSNIMVRMVNTAFDPQWPDVVVHPDNNQIILTFYSGHKHHQEFIDFIVAVLARRQISVHFEED